ncbi:UNVERIFIED_CONTAM: cation transport ATPase [Brevibacillus sp. OAP136]
MQRQLLNRLAVAFWLIISGILLYLSPLYFNWYSGIGYILLKVIGFIFFLIGIIGTLIEVTVHLKRISLEYCSLGLIFLIIAAVLHKFSALFNNFSWIPKMFVLVMFLISVGSILFGISEFFSKKKDRSG